MPLLVAALASLEPAGGADDPTEWDRAAAVAALGEYGAAAGPAVGVLRRVLGDRSPEVRARAALALAAVRRGLGPSAGDGATVDALLAALGDDRDCTFALSHHLATTAAVGAAAARALRDFPNHAG